MFMGELKQMGIKNPDLIAIPSTRNDAAFLFTVVGESQLMLVKQATGQPTCTKAIQYRVFANSLKTFVLCLAAVSVQSKQLRPHSTLNEFNDLPLDLCVKCDV